MQSSTKALFYYSTIKSRVHSKPVTATMEAFRIAYSEHGNVPAHTGQQF